MRIIKKVPVYKKTRKSKLYSKSVRYGIADKSVARMYSDLEKEIFLIEKKLESLKYKVRYYSFWNKIVSAFQITKNKVTGFIESLYNSASKKIESIFSVEVDEPYQVSDFIDSATGKFNMEKFRKFVEYLFTFSSKNQPKNYAESVQPKILTELDKEIESAAQNAGGDSDQQEQLFDAIGSAVVESLDSNLGLKAVKSKHQSSSPEKDSLGIKPTIEAELNKLIRRVQQVKIYIFEGKLKNRFWLLVISFLLFLASLVIAYEFKELYILFYIAHKVYFATAIILTFALLAYAIILFGRTYGAAIDKANEYRKRMKDRLIALAEKIDSLKESDDKEQWQNIQSLFAERMSSATDQIKSLVEKHKRNWFREGALKEGELEQVYQQSFAQIEGYLATIEDTKTQAEPAVAGRSRLIRRKNRIFSSDKHVIKKKLRYR
ncbi:MAG: hypothetical protein QW255_05405 [Candidatus Bilamarchaeaceae archaeon]